ncbi:hypothetical protein VQH23_26350 (plasmid) [Pararoseomonas sp. SCSIO 73927]|uniref:hypothetical protein n=1 Tax=Pararoseomonas sp. SCSIO 73927 TaxID=3114537 RepID=UPI0030D22147
MMTTSPNAHYATSRLVALIREQGRWPTIAQPLHEALAAEVWREQGFPSPTAWIDRLAALGGRSVTYLSRCGSAARFLHDVADRFPGVDLEAAWSRPLSAIEAFRRETGNEWSQIEQRLGQLMSGELPAHAPRKQEGAASATPAKAERMWFEQTVLRALPALLPTMGYSADTRVLVEPRTPLFRPDILLIDPTSGATSIIEVKSALSQRHQMNLAQQLLAYSTLSHTVWLVLPSDSEVPGQAILDSLRQAAIHHVGVLLIDPANAEVAELLAPEREAPETESRAAFRQQALAAHRVET